MARLLQVFGFLSVLFRGATLTFQSLAIGGIVFLIFVVRRVNEDSSALEQACLRWIRRSAIALAVMQISYVLANSMILRQSAGMSLREVTGANFCLAGLIGIVAAFTVIALTAARRSTGYARSASPRSRHHRLLRHDQPLHGSLGLSRAAGRLHRPASSGHGRLAWRPAVPADCRPASAGSGLCAPAQRQIFANSLW